MPELCMDPQKFSIRIDREEYDLCTYISDCFSIRTISCMIGGVLLTVTEHRSIHNNVSYFKAVYGDKVRFFVSDAPFLK